MSVLANEIAGKHGYTYSDGGRLAAGRKGSAGDCAVRALSIVTGHDYAEVYKTVAELCRAEKPSKTRRGLSSPRTGIHAVTFHKLAEHYGLGWVGVMKIGRGVTVHVDPDELPAAGRMVLRLSRHYSAYIDGVVHDDHDPRRGGTRAVYGYWMASAS